MARILLLNGPNLNLLGTREPQTYGTTTLPEIVARLTELARAKGHELLAFQSNGERELIVRAGEVLVIPSNLPHSAVALEDTLDVDVFNPPRQDWLSGTDAYLRR